MGVHPLHPKELMETKWLKRTHRNCQKIDEAGIICSFHKDPLGIDCGTLCEEFWGTVLRKTGRHTCMRFAV